MCERRERKKKLPFLKKLASLQHLTPDEWDAQLCGGEVGAVVLDTRNYYEVDVGAFMYERHVTVDPRLRRFSQFPLWVQQHRDLLDGRKVRGGGIGDGFGIG